MSELPDDFDSMLAQVLEPRDRNAAAEIIESAAALDDDGLRRFLGLFAERVRASAAPIRSDELRSFLRTASRGRGGP